MCENIPETVFHFIMNCPKYNLPRQKVIKSFSTCNLKLPLNGDNNLTFQPKYYLELCMDFLCQLCSFLKTILCYLKHILFLYKYFSFIFSTITHSFSLCSHDDSKMLLYTGFYFTFQTKISFATGSRLTPCPINS